MSKSNPVALINALRDIITEIDKLLLSIELEGKDSPELLASLDLGRRLLKKYGKEK